MKRIQDENISINLEIYLHDELLFFTLLLYIYHQEINNNKNFSTHK